ncbi:hypothetical protein ACQ86O_14555 [Serratia sp. L9]|uniref:hypothetical protein n=1 Tax=Serratia sp. L9 TaxID=3423946 RepID=UPI003D66CECB
MTAIKKYSLIGALLVAIALGGINAVLTSRLDKANAANQTLSDTNKALIDAVEDRDGTITALTDAASADRRATEEQLRIEQQKRAKADAENRTLRQALEHSDAGNQPLPDDVKRILRREG